MIVVNLELWNKQPLVEELNWLFNDLNLVKLLSNFYEITDIDLHIGKGYDGHVNDPMNEDSYTYFDLEHLNSIGQKLAVEDLIPIVYEDLVTNNSMSDSDKVDQYCLINRQDQFMVCGVKNSMVFPLLHFCGNIIVYGSPILKDQIFYLLPEQSHSLLLSAMLVNY